MGAHAERLALQEKGYRGQRHYYAQDEIRAFERGWAEKMVDIWLERDICVEIRVTWNSLALHIVKKWVTKMAKDMDVELLVLACHSEQ